MGNDSMTATSPESSTEHTEYAPLPSEALLTKEGAPPKMRLTTLLAIPMATLVAFGIQFSVSKARPVSEAQLYWILLAILFLSALLAAGLQFLWPRPRKWLAHISPIIAGTILLLAIWDLITTGFHLLPLPYFPGPAAVLQSLISDRPDHWHLYRMV
jgi:NitT/TauT family transport system permease protein